MLDSSNQDYNMTSGWKVSELILLHHVYAQKKARRQVDKM